MTNDIRECLASIEHDQWMHWAQNILDTERISPTRAKRWSTLMIPYNELPEYQKDADREWADRVIACIEEHSLNANEIINRLYMYYADMDGELFDIPIDQKWIVEEIVKSVLEIVREVCE